MRRSRALASGWIGALGTAVFVIATTSLGAPSAAFAATYTGYTQGQVMATYDSIAYPAMAAPPLDTYGDPSVALNAYKGPLIVHANLGDATVSSGLGYQWQCVELVQRYFYGKGWTTKPVWGSATAANLYRAVPKNASGYPEATWYPSGSLLVAPRVGDALVFKALVVRDSNGKVDPAKSWPSGHVALITGVSSSRVTFIEQNVTVRGVGPIALDQVSITKQGTGFGVTYSIGSTSAHGSGVTYPPVLGWIHAVKNTRKAPAAPVLVPSSGAALAQRYTGSWVNADSATRWITRLSFAAQPNGLVMDAWGKCYPTDCHWAESAPQPVIPLGAITSRGFTAAWVFSFATDTITVAPNADGSIEVTDSTHFTDNSGRADYTMTGRFVRQASTPAPGVDRFTAVTMTVGKQYSPSVCNTVTVTKYEVPLASPPDVQVWSYRGSTLFSEHGLFDPPGTYTWKVWLRTPEFPTLDGNPTTVTLGPYTVGAICPPEGTFLATYP